MKPSEFQKLLRKYQNDCISDKERELVEAWLDEVNRAPQNKMWEQKEINDLKGKIFESIQEETQTIRNRPLLKIAITSIAASCLLILGLYLFQQKTKDNVAQIVKAESIYPSTKQATITLENGEVITLSNGANSLLSKNGDLLLGDGNELLHNLDDKLKNQKVILSTPKGRQVSIVLDDGTKVWLNANSKLTYPLVFNQKQRVVELDGEAYFEVSYQEIDESRTRGQMKPFIVVSMGQNIEVLGTKFNVKDYSVESHTTTTLLSGLVNISNSLGDQYLLKPNQEASLSKSSHKVRINTVDAEESINWKNNLFSFQNADLKEIMTEIKRWYDIRVDIDHWPADRFYGQVGRNEPLSSVIEMIEASSSLRFKVVQVNNEMILSLQ